jgi:putative ABC transport system permease protein
VRTFMSLATRPLGLEPDRVLLVDIRAPRSRFGQMDLNPVFERARVAVAALPGVTRAALSWNPPVTGGQVWNMSVRVEGAPATVERQRLLANAVTPQWLATVGTPLLAGRNFTADDRTGAPVAIVNRTFARMYGLGESPIGRVILRKDPGSTHETRVPIIGLAADAVYTVPRDPIPPTMYVPLTRQDQPPSSIVLSVRAAGSPASLAKSVAAAIAAVHPDLVLAFTPLADQVRATMIQERLLAMLSGFFGALALLLAGLGLYGITAYTISRRRNEIGIRMALGAPSSNVIRLVLTRVVVLVVLGLLIGAAASAWGSRLVASLLYGVDPHDLWTLIGASSLLAAISALAGWLPARRAARIDPAAVLRES